MASFDAKSMFRGTVLRSGDPILIYSGMYAAQGGPTAFDALADALKDRDVVWLILVAWTAEKTSSASVITEWRQSLLERYPRHRFVFLANTHAEKRYLRSLGNECLFHHQNMFVDANLFHPMDCEHKFEVVYNAQFLPFKRHELCVDLDDLVLIGYNFSNPHYEAVRAMLPAATFANIDSDGRQLWLSQKNVNEIYNQSSVALCLSRHEGAMHASMEYLLSGLPIVTTISQGGRDHYFDGRYVRWVSDDPAAIREAVENLADEAIDRSMIRAETIRKIDDDRQKFFVGIGSLVGLEASVLQRSFEENYNDKLITPSSIHDILARLGIS